MNNNAAEDVKDWADLVRRLRIYSKAVSALGGLNDLDKVLCMAADGIEKYVPGAFDENNQGILDVW